MMRENVGKTKTRKKRGTINVKFAVIVMAIIATAMSYYSHWTKQFVLASNSLISLIKESAITLPQQQQEEEEQKQALLLPLLSPPSIETPPHNLIFTYKDNLLKTKEPRELYDNVVQTIRMYQNAWGIELPETSASSTTDDDLRYDHISNVYFLTDKECKEIIQQTEPRLLHRFVNEKIGMLRGDICRISALYLYGGYYMDLDLRAIHPFLINNDNNADNDDKNNDNDNFNIPSDNNNNNNNNSTTTTNDTATTNAKIKIHKNLTFVTVNQTDSKQSTVWGEAKFFQAFIVSTPKHPILKKTFDVMVDYYNNDTKRNSREHMGVITLGKAYNDLRVSLLSSTAAINTEDKKNNNNAAVATSVDNNKNDKLLLYFQTSKLLGEALITDTNKEYWGYSLQNGIGCCCNYVVHDSIQKIPYFFSRFPSAIKRSRQKKLCSAT